MSIYEANPDKPGLRIVDVEKLKQRVKELEQRCGRFADKKVVAEQRIAELEKENENLGRYIKSLGAVCDDLSTIKAKLTGAVAQKDKRIAELEANLETEQMRIVACGVVANANTVKSALAQRDMLDKYKTASLADVIRVVDSEIALRDKVAELEAHYTHLFNAACDNCYWEEGDGHGTVHTEIPEWLGNFSKGEKYETPKQSLAHIQREAIEEVATYVEMQLGSPFTSEVTAQTIRAQLKHGDFFDCTKESER